MQAAGICTIVWGCGRSDRIDARTPRQIINRPVNLDVVLRRVLANDDIDAEEVVIRNKQLMMAGSF